MNRVERDGQTQREQCGGGRSSWKKKVCLCVGVALALVAIACAAFVLTPLPDDFLASKGAVAVRFTDRRGRLLREVRSFDDGRSVPLPANEPIPPNVAKAFVAFEDRRFHSHFGVDGRAVIGALKANLSHGRIVRGASTIHMQLTRLVWSRPRGLWGKAKEALWALRIGMHLPREEILREYLNRVPLGRDLLGVEAASEFYFGRPASALSLAQAAMLASMAHFPLANDPFRHLDQAKQSMALALEVMANEGVISAEEKSLALHAPLDLTKAHRAFLAPHLMAHLIKSLGSLGLTNAVTVETTLDLELQEKIERAMAVEIQGLSEERVGNGAVIVVDNASGDVLAYVGSVDFFDEENGGQNDGVRALRQPGSALKPFAYGLALMGEMTPATIFADVETHLATPTGSYVPKNYDRTVHGPVRLRAALANSYNVPAVQLAEHLGPDAVLSVLQAAGFDSLDQTADHYGVGIVLGNGEVTLRELARAYRGLALGGVVGPLREIRRAFDAKGRVLEIPDERETSRFLSAQSVALLTDILSDEAARISAFGHTNALRLPFPTAAKTGTSRAHVDNWVAGFTRERTVAVWVGNFSGKSMKGVSGITGAGPVFRRAMLLAMEGIEPKPLVDPDEFHFDVKEICPLSGQLVGPFCDGVIRENFLPKTAPTQVCAVHQADGSVRLPLEYEAWGRSVGLKLSEDFLESLTPKRRGEAHEDVYGESHDVDGASDAQPRFSDASHAHGQARFLFPSDGDEFLLDPLLPLSSQAVRIRVIPPDDTSFDELFIEVSGAKNEVLALDKAFGTSAQLPVGQSVLSLKKRGKTSENLADVPRGELITAVRIHVR